MVGRCSAAPSAFVNSRLVTGLGATRFTGPLTGSAVSRKMIAATSSSMVIQLVYWRPLPSRPPRPSLKIGSCSSGRRRGGKARSRYGCGRPGCPLPQQLAVEASQVADELRQEAVALGAGLVEQPVAGVSVVADGASGDAAPWESGTASRARRRAGSCAPTRLSRQRLLVLVRPSPAADPGAGEIDGGVDPGQICRIQLTLARDPSGPHPGRSAPAGPAGRRRGPQP